MNPTIQRLKLIFVGVFLAINIALLIWQAGWVWPRQRCEQAHRWWDSSQRVCAQPVLVSDITGRIIEDDEGRRAAERALGRATRP